MSAGVKEPKRAAAKRDGALPEDTAQSPSLNEAQFPFSGIHDRLTKYREILCRELTQRGADPRSFKGRGIESLLGEVAAQIAQNIETAIAACPPHDLPKLKQAISNATFLDGKKLLSGSSFTNRTEDDLRSTSFEEWCARIDGEIRTRIVIGESSEKAVKNSLAGILKSDELRSMLCGTEGYVWVSELFSQGRMKKGYQLMSALCKFQKVHFDSELGWEAQFPGSVGEFATLRKEFRDTDYQGLDGYVAFSNDHAEGDMKKGYELMSALCKFEKVNFDAEIVWEAQFQGTTKEFATLRKEFRDTDYQGLDGYIKFSDRYAKGDMLKGYKLMSALCKFEKVNFTSELGWEAKFEGTTGQFATLREECREPRYQGLDGYVAFSNEHAGGDMKKGYQLMSALCKFEKVNFTSELGWEAAFLGTTKDFATLRKEFREPRYQGLDGYIKFSDRYANGDMLKGYILMSALCKFEKVNFDAEIVWEAQFQGTTKEFATLRKEFREPRYQGLDGYVAFSNEHAGGDMQKGYQLMSALCKFEKVNFDNALRWPPVFAGAVKQYTFIQQSLLEHAEGLAELKKVSKNGRLVALHQLLQTIPAGDVIADLPLEELFAALPEQVSTLARGDFSPACLRLVVGVDGAQQTVYFDSAPERICGYLLHRYGLIKSFVEKENLHVRPSQSSRITLDFKVRGRAGEAVFIEYHPLSRRDLAEGISLEEAGRRKRESVADGEFAGATVHHIWELEQLFDVVRECDAEFDLSFEQFLEDIKEAKALGRKLDQEDAQHLAEVLKGLKL